MIDVARARSRRTWREGFGADFSILVPDFNAPQPKVLVAWRSSYGGRKAASAVDAHGAQESRAGICAIKHVNFSLRESYQSLAAHTFCFQELKALLVRAILHCH